MNIKYATSLLSFFICMLLSGYVSSRLYVVHQQYSHTVADSPGKKNESARERRKRERRKEKQKRRRERRERKRRSHAVATRHTHMEPRPKPAEAPVVTLQQPDFPPTTIRSRYRIDALAPLYLADWAANKKTKKVIPEKARAGMDFYFGLQIAADSLKKAGYNFDLYIHDAAANKDSVLDKETQNSLDSTDLIIGAVPSKDVNVLADFAQHKQVNFVSALSPADAGVKDNPYLTLLEPTLKSHCYFIDSEVARIYIGTKVVIMHRALSVPDDNAFRYLTSDSALHINFSVLSCEDLPDKAGAQNLFDSNKTNVVIMPLFELPVADSMVAFLTATFPHYKFVVYGMPNWNNERFCKKLCHPDISIFSSVTNRVEPTRAESRYVAETCENNFGEKASDNTYRGYEALCWYAALLRKYGREFGPGYLSAPPAPFSSFRVTLNHDDNGDILYYENKQISSLQLVKTQAVR